MDLGLFASVLWRAKRLVLAGLVLAVLLAGFAYGKPGFSGGHISFKPRFASVYQAEAQLLIGQSDYPYRQPGETEPSRALGSLSPIYANLANGSEVQGEIVRQLGKGAKVKAFEDVDLAASSFLPFVNFIATSSNPAEATRFAQGAASIFQTFIARQQTASGVVPSKRIQLSLVSTGVNPKLSEGHKPSIAILVFVALLVGTVALVLIKENTRQRSASALQAQHASDVPTLEPVPPPADVESELAHAGSNGNGSNGAHDGKPAVHRDRVMSSSAEW